MRRYVMNGRNQQERDWRKKPQAAIQLLLTYNKTRMETIQYSMKIQIKNNSKRISIEQDKTSGNP